jgi:pimeloyl-ACP methyl ester carboxylesterase
MDRRKMLTLAAAAAAGAAVAPSVGVAGWADPTGGSTGPADSTLAGSLPGGFRSERAQVNGTVLHYVAGGRGAPLVLLPGWPQTWWTYHRIMPALARRYRVIAVDLRGMGGSDKPQGGYDKKTMARDVAELANRLGYAEINIAGHDIGSMVAFSFAINHPDATRKVALLDVPHPDSGLFDQKLVPESPTALNLWWFAFNQLSGLPEQLLAGRSRYLVDWIFDNIPLNPAAIDDQDRTVYAQAYDCADAIRAGNGWYQSWYQDIEDMAGYGKVTVPMLGLGTDQSYPYLQYLWPSQGTDVQVTKIEGTNHFMVDEQPEAVTQALLDFFG